jgi:hypothetical protein
VRVQRSSRFVHADDGDIVQSSARQAHKLHLAKRPGVRAEARDHAVQATRLSSLLREANRLDDVGELSVSVVVEGVQVVTNGGSEHDGLLGDDGQAATLLLEGQSCDVDAADQDASLLQYSDNITMGQQ